MKRKKALVLFSLFILMAAVIAQFPVLPTISGTAEEGEQLNLHAVNPMTGEGMLIDLYAPESTIWHELWPVFCGGPYHLWYWKDNNYDGKLSPCDKVDLMNVSDPDNPVFVGGFHVDNVTVTLLVANMTKGDPFHPAFIEFKGDIQEFPWDAPICTEWFEKWPVYGLQYHLSSWIDTDGSGTLTVCDIIDMDFGAGLEDYHVVEIATDIWLTAMPMKDYVTMGGKVDGTLYLYVQNYLPNCRIPYGGIALPMLAPFVTRPPLLKPMCLFEEFVFSPAVDVDQDGIDDIIPIQKIQLNPIVHYVFVGPPARPPPGAWWRFTLIAPAPGGGVIFINPALPGDVDCYTFNNDTGVWWGPESPLAGQKAAESGGHYNEVTGDFVPSMEQRFPGGGQDGIPGTSLWGDPADGFGDGVPDPAGSSILMLPLVLMGDEYNATTGLWEPTMAVPMPLVLTTGKAYDHVAAVDPTPGDPPGECFLYCMASLEEGSPWETVKTPLNLCDLRKVTYVCAWSNLLYCLNPDSNNDGIPDPDPDGFYYTMDHFYEYVEFKVDVDVAIGDINGDGIVDIFDCVIIGVAYGARDEGYDSNGDGLPDVDPADPKYDPRADTDCNGFIDFWDLMKVTPDFGKRLDP